MTRPIADLWATFAERVLPAGAGETQKVETKRAFYAGAHGLFELVAHAAGTKTDDEGLAYMEEIEADALMFAKDVLEGKA